MIYRILTLLVLLALLPHVAAQELKDPWENWNRKVFAFNEGMDKWFLRPVAKSYQFIMPEVLDQGVSNVFSNIGELPTSVFAILQGKPKTTGRALLRFLINSTLGVVGIFDIAKLMGIHEQKEDFAQTLAVWGVPSGNYMVLPFLGPSTLREASSIPVDIYSNPITYTIDDRYARYGAWGLRVIDARADLIKAEALISGDKYTFYRNAYWQQRQYLIHDGQVLDDFDNSDFDDDDWLDVDEASLEE